MSINSSLKLSLLKWFLAFSIIPILIMSYAGYKQVSENTYETAIKRLQETSSLNVKFISNWFKFRKSDISAWSESSQNVEFLEKLISEFENSQKSLGEFSKSFDCVALLNKYQDDLLFLAHEYDYVYDIFFIDAKGNILYSNLQESDFGTNLKDGIYSQTLFAKSYNETVESGKITFSDLEKYTPSDKQLTGFLNAPVIDKDGDIIGVFSIQIRYEAFTSGLQYTDTFFAYLASKDGHLRSTVQAKQDIFGVKLNKEQISIVNSSNHQAIKYKNTFGNNVIGLHQDVNLFNVKWVLINEIDEDALFASINKLLMYGLMFVTTLILLLIIMSIYIARKITKPIENLTYANQQFIKGKRDISVEVSHENRELSQLTSSFNSMISALTTNERELNKQTKNAQAALEAKGEFLASMSHEIRTPMNGVIGMLGLLINTRLSATQLDYVSVAQTSADSLLMLINDILDYSKVEAGKIELDEIEFNIYDELRMFLQTMEYHASKKSVNLLLDMSQLQHSIVIADPLRIRQILNNLVSNAIKFTDKGDVKVTALLKKLSATDARLIYKIEDSGIGIPEEKIDVLFDSFSQVDKTTTRKYGGTGLGLAIVKKLVELMDGTINVTSTVGSGSCFEVDIHIRLSDKPMVVQKHSKTIDFKNTSWSKNLKLLLVEDNKTNQVVAKGILNSFGFEVEVVENGYEAIELLKKTPKETFALILMDCQMPVMDGYDATRAIRAAKAGDDYQDIPIVAMTANAMRGDKEKCFACGMDDYVAKPIDLSVLKNVLEKWIDAQQINFTNEAIVTPLMQERNIEEKRKNLLWDQDLLLIKVGNDGKVVKTIVESFINDMDMLIKKIKKESVNDHKDLAKNIHTIKGSSANVGANKLSLVALEIEGLLKSETVSSLQDKLEALENITKQTVESMNNYLKSSAVEIKDDKKRVEKEDLQDALQALESELNSGAFIDTSAVDIFNSVSDYEIAEDLQSLQQAINNFDTTNALKIIAIILEKVK